MANLTRKTSKSKTRMRKSANMKLKKVNAVECPQCHSKRLPHRVCKNCGYYNGKDVLALDKE